MHLLVWHDDSLVADAICGALADDDLRVFVARSLDELLERGPSVDVCLIDASSESALDAIACLVAIPQAPRVLALVSDATSARVVVRRGATGWVTTNDGLDRLLHVLKNGSSISTAGSARNECVSLAPKPRHGLTAREVEVLAGLVDGASTKALAARLGVTSATARTHVQNVLAKLGVHSRLQAVALVEQSLLTSTHDIHLEPSGAVRATG